MKIKLSRDYLIVPANSILDVVSENKTHYKAQWKGYKINIKKSDCKKLEEAKK